MTRYVDPWTTPEKLNVGDRSRNPGSLDREWRGGYSVLVCPEPCGTAMTEYDEQDQPCCPTCGISEWEAMRKLARHLRAVS